MINVEEFLKEGEATLELGKKFSYALSYLATNFDQEEIAALVNTDSDMAELNDKFEKLGKELGMGHYREG